MQIRAVPAEGSVRLVIQGELDVASAPDLVAAADAVDRPDCDLILDLRPVTFVDSHGLRAILAARSASRTRGQGMAVVRGPAEVERVFSLTRVDELLDLVWHPAQAAALLARSRGQRSAEQPLGRSAGFRAGAADAVPKASGGRTASAA